MEESKKPTEIDYYTYEESMSRAERHANRWRFAAIALFIAFVISNAVWIFYENSFTDTTTITQETPDGNNNFIGRDGDITNGETDNN